MTSSDPPPEFTPPDELPTSRGTIRRPALPTEAGTYYLRVFSGSSDSDVQRYSLEISRGQPTVPEAAAKVWYLYN